MCIANSHISGHCISACGILFSTPANIAAHTCVQCDTISVHIIILTCMGMHVCSIIICCLYP